MYDNFHIDVKLWEFRLIEIRLDIQLKLVLTFLIGQGWIDGKFQPLV
jgi:hypothetical protein